MQTPLSNNQQLNTLLVHINDAGEAAAKCSALILPLYKCADELESGNTPKVAKKLLKLINSEFIKYQNEIQKYWETPDRPKELFEKADYLQDAEFRLGVYMTIFKNCNWGQIGIGAAVTGIGIFQDLAEQLNKSISTLSLATNKILERTE